VALDGSRGGIVVRDARDLSLADGFTLEAWAATSEHRAQSILSKPNSWFLKIDPAGEWGVGVFAGKNVVSIYGKARVAGSGTTVAPPGDQVLPAGSAGSQPAAGSSSKSKSKSGIITLVIIGVIALIAALTILARRRGPLEDEDDEDEEPEAGRDSAPESRDGRAASGPADEAPAAGDEANTEVGRR
jgi:hypothetical protein